MRRSHPDIIVQVIAGDQVLDLATRQADLAIRFFRPTSNQLVAARVGQFADRERGLEQREHATGCEADLLVGLPDPPLDQSECHLAQSIGERDQ